MKIIFKIIFVFLIIIKTILAENPLKINIKLEKDTFLLGEPIQAAISVVNISTETVNTGLEVGPISVKLIDEKGSDVGTAGLYIGYFLPNTNKLDPQEEDYKVVELNSHFGKRYSVITAHQYFDIGKYTLKVIMKPHNMQADSIETTFKVIEPEGDEKIVYDEYCRLMIPVNGKSNFSSTEEFAARLEKLHELFPNSVYTEPILIKLDTIYDIFLDEHDKSISIQKELVEKYPLTAQTMGILKSRLKKISTSEERTEYLKKIEKLNKNTLMEKVIKKKLKEVE